MEFSIVALVSNEQADFLFEPTIWLEPKPEGAAMCVHRSVGNERFATHDAPRPGPPQTA